MIQRLSEATYPVIKRGGDIAASGILLVLLSPLLLAIAIAIKLDSRFVHFYGGFTELTASSV
jgi:lipopolysaccharide/colanic/teichoic acid biosynthesis glycosyltransferase